MNEVKELKSEPRVALWNPNAAVNWSVLFTPVFGAYLHALNWRALGEGARAGGSMKWVYVGIGLLIFYLLLGIFLRDGKAIGDIARLSGIVFLLSWYFSSGKAQAKYVKQRYGTSYQRRPWGKALLAAVGCLVGYFVVVVL